MSNTGFPEKLEKLLATYQKNVKNVPMEDLEGKYKKPFQRLKDEIDEVAYRILIFEAVSPFRMRKGTPESETDKIVRKVKLYYLKEKGYLRSEDATVEGWEEKARQLYLSLVDDIVMRLHGYFGVSLDDVTEESWANYQKRPNIKCLCDLTKRLRPNPVYKTFKPAARA